MTTRKPVVLRLAVLVGVNRLIWAVLPDCWTPVVLIFGAVFMVGNLALRGTVIWNLE